MNEINVILISSVRPENTTATSILLHRHLVNQSGISVKILPAEDHEIAGGSLRSKIIPRLKRTQFVRWAEDAGLLLHAEFPIGRSLPPPTTPASNTLVLTVAAFNGCWVAQRYARQHGLPLAVRFEDWWPDCVGVHSWMKGYLEKKFIELHQSASVSISTSEGMRTNLGPHPNAHVVFPIPEAGRVAAPAKVLKEGTPFKVCYLGNMYDYGPMLAGVAQEAKSQSKIRIEFRGHEPRWPERLKQEMRSKGLLHDFGRGMEFEKWFENFDAYLVAMFFEPEQRRRVETCFATKLLEYSGLGKPIVIWSPAYSSAARFASETGAGIIANAPEPQAVVSAIVVTLADPARWRDAGRAAARVAANELNTERLHGLLCERLALSRLRPPAR